MFRKKETAYDAVSNNFQDSPDKKNASKGSFQNTDQENEIIGGKTSWDIEDDEINVVKCVLSIKTMTTEEKFQPLNNVFVIEQNNVLTEERGGNFETLDV